MKSDFNKINSFTDLKVWQLAHEFKLEIYEFVQLLPESEKFNRVSQLKRAACSVTANIAEGFGRYHFQENIQFCRQARGSLEEVLDNVITSKDLNETPKETCNHLIKKCMRVRMLLNGYIRYLNNLKSKMRNTKSETRKSTA